MFFKKYQKKHTTMKFGLGYDKNYFYLYNMYFTSMGHSASAVLVYTEARYVAQRWMYIHTSDVRLKIVRRSDLLFGRTSKRKYPLEKNILKKLLKKLVYKDFLKHTKKNIKL